MIAIAPPKKLLVRAWTRVGHAVNAFARSGEAPAGVQSSVVPTGTAPIDTFGIMNEALGEDFQRDIATELTTRLEAEGYTGSVYQAAYGFKNLGQFVAATNVSKNLESRSIG